VIAFLTWVAEQVDAAGYVGEARFMHQGMTSSDVLDTCLAVQLAQASDLLLADLDALLEAIKRRALSTSSPPPSAAATASMPSPSPSASKWRKPMPSFPAARRA
jgi:adenylosuccinate lyase